jgi:hypothetical protein
MEETGRTHDVLAAGKRLRDGRREITTVSSKSVGLLVVLRHSKQAISQILDACRYSNASALQDEAIRKYFEAAAL